MDTHLALGPALGKSFRWPEIVVPIVLFSVLGQVLPAVLATIGGVLLIRRARAGRPVALAGFVVALIAGVGSLVFGYTAPVPSIALLVVIVVIGLIVALSGCELTPPSQ